MAYEERVKAVAGMWQYVFESKSLDDGDTKQFREDCKSWKVDILDVLGEIN